VEEQRTAERNLARHLDPVLENIVMEQFITTANPDLRVFLGQRDATAPRECIRKADNWDKSLPPAEEGGSSNNGTFNQTSIRFLVLKANHTSTDQNVTIAILLNVTANRGMQRRQTKNQIAKKEKGICN